MGGALPATGAPGISKTSNRSPPPPVSGAAKLFVMGEETAGPAPMRSKQTRYQLLISVLKNVKICPVQALS